MENFTLGSRKQSNVGFKGEADDKITRFAAIFHGGKYATAVRILALDGLTRIHTEEDYLEALKKLAPLLEEEKRSRPAPGPHAVHKKGKRASSF